jgi:N-acetyl-anhydromuramyl-L-alanine amidase AmpD
MGKIWVAGVGFEVDAKVVRWDQGPGFNARAEACIRSHQSCPGGVLPYSRKKPVSRRNRTALRPSLRSLRDNPSLSAAQAVIRQFVLHHDGCPDAASCFNVLHNERGLSCHFLLDNDGTIYQTLDLAFMAFHAAGFNANSIGIEMSNRGDAKAWPSFYATRGQARDVTTCRIHGHTYLAFEYTDAQHKALAALVRGLSRALPNMPIDYPQESPGYQAWGELPGAHSYAGLLGHYHTTRRKWDPGPFDFKKFCESVRGRLSFPLALAKGEQPDVPDDTEELRAAADQLYIANEQRAEAGFFPVGPYGEHRLWHGGVHLSASKGDPVYAPFAGRVMAVRQGGTSGVGSTNFVLMRHDMAVGPRTIRFFTLYFHLADEKGTTPRGGSDGTPGWMESETWKLEKSPRDVILIDEPVEGGDVIGHVGLAGPDLRPQVHFEVFAAEEVTGMIQPGVFTIVDGTAGGRFSTAKAVNESIDIDPSDGKLSRRELLEFFTSNSDRNLARYYGTLHVSEWIASPSWVDSLKLAPEFSGISDQELQALVGDQITPTLWWSDRVAQHAKLPRDGVVYHYNAVTFVKFINEKLQEANALTDVGLGAFDVRDAKERPADVLGDIEDVDGESFVDESELEAEDFGQDLTLEDLANGFPE